MNQLKSHHDSTMSCCTQCNVASSTSVATVHLKYTELQECEMPVSFAMSAISHLESAHESKEVNSQRAI